MKWPFGSKSHRAFLFLRPRPLVWVALQLPTIEPAHPRRRTDVRVCVSASVGVVLLAQKRFLRPVFEAVYSLRCILVSARAPNLHSTLCCGEIRIFVCWWYYVAAGNIATMPSRAALGGRPGMPRRARLGRPGSTALHGISAMKPHWCHGRRVNNTHTYADSERKHTFTHMTFDIYIYIYAWSTIVNILFPSQQQP